MRFGNYEIVKRWHAFECWLGIAVMTASFMIELSFLSLRSCPCILCISTEVEMSSLCFSEFSMKTGSERMESLVDTLLFRFFCAFGRMRGRWRTCTDFLICFRNRKNMWVCSIATASRETHIRSRMLSRAEKEMTSSTTLACRSVMLICNSWSG
jgi:hypothetical protein